MKTKFNTIKFVKILSAISERQLKNAAKAADLILSVLDANGVNYAKHYFQIKIPKVKKAVLLADSKKIPALASSFVSGKIHNKDHLISSETSSQKFLYETNINFNPYCNAISRNNFYFAPSVAIDKKDVSRILKAKKIKGEVKVTPVKHKALSILVGNMVNPKTILFAHYDSLGPGAIDNASGTAILLKLIIDYPQTLKDALYVVDGNEELSYDQPVYWGHGYRVFEQKFKSILSKAKKIIIVDGLGHASTIITNDSGIIQLGFPIKNANLWQEKITMVYGNLDKMMKVYHSGLDKPHLLKHRYLNESINKILKLIKTANQ